MFADAPRTLADILERAAGHGEAVMTVDGDVRHSFASVFGRSAAMAATLQRTFRVARGDRVALAIGNSVEWMIGFIGIAALGAVPVLVNTRSAPEELGHALGLSGIAVAIIDGERLRLLREASLSLPSGMVVLTDDAACLRPGLDMAFAAAVEGEMVLRPVGTAPEDGGAVLFTSGTTGHPKGALLSQRALAHGVMLGLLLGAMNDAAFAKDNGLSPEAAGSSIHSPTIIGGPLFHLGGVNPFLRCLYTGTPTILLRKWDAESVLALIAREQVRRIAMVPTMYWDLLRAPDPAGALGSIRFISSGAAPILPGLVAELRQRIPQLLLGNTYGSTETSGYVASSYGRDFLEHPTSCGHVLPTVHVRLIADDGRDVANGEAGEICVRSAAVMDSYLDDPDATAAAFIDGWFRTGDIGRMNDAGLLHIVDRKKNMVISGGENIYCAEVERVLSEHEAVREVVAFGLPDPRLGERLAVTLFPAPGTDIDAAGIKAYAAGRLAIYKVPRDIIFAGAPLPRTASGKLDRAAVILDAQTRR
ncbi:MAG: class I adenylate-forming enzyme family protein [Sphingomonadaceae bacterium]|nr:class I adenylate-forming enzyme family protein [Sphingomonadaceae bacterium]